MSFQIGREPFKREQPKDSDTSLGALSTFTRLAEARREWDEHVEKARRRTFNRLGIRER